MICQKCKNYIRKKETEAWLKGKRVCQSCYNKRNNKLPSNKAYWWKQWMDEFKK